MAKNKVKSIKIWFVPFPTWKLETDVKQIALEKGYRIIDAKFKDDERFENEDKYEIVEHDVKFKSQYAPKVPVNVPEMLSRIGSLKADELRALAEEVDGVEYTNVDETRAAIKTACGIE